MSGDGPHAAQPCITRPIPTPHGPQARAICLSMPFRRVLSTSMTPNPPLWLPHRAQPGGKVRPPMPHVGRGDQSNAPNDPAAPMGAYDSRHSGVLTRQLGERGMVPVWCPPFRTAGHVARPAGGVHSTLVEVLVRSLEANVVGSECLHGGGGRARRSGALLAAAVARGAAAV